VILTRLIGQAELPQLDPFLLLDYFESGDPRDYIAGFPDHPHRGFETLTYLLAGRMRHRDSRGHEGVIEPGGVQWMSAGRGIVHSEMPEQVRGRLAGFQLWVNLPAKHKMDSPAYQEFAPGEIPRERRGPGVLLKVVAGVSSRGTLGPVRQPLTAPLYLHLSLAAGETLEEPLEPTHNAFVYLIQGTLWWPGPAADEERLEAGRLAVLGPGRRIRVRAGRDSQFLLLTGRPLHEPMARAGPFVMNSRAQLQEAYRDYLAGRLGAD